MVTEDEVNKSTGWNNGLRFFFSHIAAENKKGLSHANREKAEAKSMMPKQTTRFSGKV